MRNFIRLGAVAVAVGVLASGSAIAGDGPIGRLVRNRQAPSLMIDSKGQAFLVWKNGAKTPVVAKDGKLVTPAPKVAVKAKNGQVVEVCPNCPPSK